VQGQDHQSFVVMYEGFMRGHLARYREGEPKVYRSKGVVGLFKRILILIIRLFWGIELSE
jgi:hypothetical protein